MAIIDDTYDYDQNGNVAGISVALSGQLGNRDMSYDDLDRLKCIFGTGTGTRQCLPTEWYKEFLRRHIRANPCQVLISTRHGTKAMKCTSSTLFLTGLLLASCGSAARSEGAFSCSLQPDYRSIPSSEISTLKLIETYLTQSKSDQLRITRQAAEDVERRLSSEGQGDFEAWFYQSQIERLTDYCDAENDRSKRLVAMAFIERQAAALSNAAQLHSAEDSVVDGVLPNTSPNLDSRMNSLVLASGCSRSSHPLLAESLRRIGLPCADS